MLWSTLECNQYQYQYQYRLIRLRCEPEVMNHTCIQIKYPTALFATKAHWRRFKGRLLKGV